MNKIASERDVGPEAVDVARRMYKAYLANSDGKSWDGKPCPTWENLTPAVRGHWCAAAIAGLDAAVSAAIAEGRRSELELEARIVATGARVEELQRQLDALVRAEAKTPPVGVPAVTKPSPPKDPPMPSTPPSPSSTAAADPSATKP